MKRIPALAAAAALILSLCACGAKPAPSSEVPSAPPVTAAPAPTAATAVSQWTETLDLNTDMNTKEEPPVTKLNVSFNGHTYTAALADNPSADAFLALLREQGGSVTIAAHDYGNFEKVGPLGSTIVRSDRPTDTVPGDIILYLGSSICLYYSTNSWDFTPLGRLEGDLSSLRAHLGDGDVSITYALAD